MQTALNLEQVTISFGVTSVKLKIKRMCLFKKKLQLLATT